MSTSQKNEITPLTGLRGIAASWVVIYHLHENDVLKGIVGNLVIHGYLAVDIFFVLSGLVMGLSYQKFFADGFRLDHYRIFLIRRIARVYPLYLITTLVVAFMNYKGISHSWTVSLSDFIANILLVQGWGLGSSINTPAWSVSTELAAYLLFPLMVFILLSAPRWLKAGVLLLAYLTILYLGLYYTPSVHINGVLDISDTKTLYPLLRCMAEFFIGLACYQLIANPFIKILVSSLPLAATSFFLLLVALAMKNTDFMVFLLIPFLVTGLATGNDRVCRFFGSPVPVFLGEISYSLYLVHSQFLRIRHLGDDHLSRYLGESAADMVSVAVFYSVVVCCSYLVFRYVEKPARTILRKI